jgi:hypothetical protein
MTVLFPQNVLNLEMLDLGSAAAGFLVKGPKFRAIHAILALHLFDHQFRVGDHPQAPVPVGDGKFQGGEKRGVLSKVVGPGTQVLAQFSKNPSGGVLDVNTEACRARIAAGSPVAVSDNSVGDRGAKAAI